jgi:hypothetical protein
MKSATGKKQQNNSLLAAELNKLTYTLAACIFLYRLGRRVGTMNLDTCTTVAQLKMI